VAAMERLLAEEWLDSSPEALRNLSAEAWERLQLPVQVKSRLRGRLHSSGGSSYTSRGAVISPERSTNRQACSSAWQRSCNAASGSSNSSSLPQRRRTSCNGPPGDVHLRGWGSFPAVDVAAALAPKPARKPLRAQSATGLVPRGEISGTLNQEDGRARRAEWFREDVLKCLRARGVAGQVALAKLFYNLPKDLDEVLLIEIVRDLALPCLGVEDIPQFAVACLGPALVSRDVVLERLRGNDTQARASMLRETFSRLLSSRGPVVPCGHSDAMLSTTSLRESFAPAMHPDVLARRKAAGDVLGDFFKLLEAEGLDPAGELTFAEVARVCGAYGALVEEDASFSAVLRNILPGKGDASSIGSMLERFRAAFQRLPLAKLEAIAKSVSIAVSEGHPEALFEKPNFPKDARVSGLVMHMPTTSSPAFATDHGRFFRGHKYVSERARMVPEQIPSRPRDLDRNLFTTWVRSLRLYGVTDVDAECIFAYFDEDGSAEMGMEEVVAMVQALGKPLSSKRSEALDAVCISKGFVAEESAGLRLRATLASFSSDLSSESAFSTWLLKAAKHLGEVPWDPGQPSVVEQHQTPAEARQHVAEKFAEKQLSAGRSTVSSDRRRELGQSRETSRRLAPFRSSIFGA